MQERKTSLKIIMQNSKNWQSVSTRITPCKIKSTSTADFGEKKMIFSTENTIIPLNDNAYSSGLTHSDWMLTTHFSIKKPM